jgi:glycine cleavage system H protein
MATPTDRRYSMDDMWVMRKADGTALVGFTERVGKVMGEIMVIDLPDAGTRLEAGERIGALEAVTAATVYSTPLTGIVTAVNRDLLHSPEQINQDPYGNGWVMELRSESVAEFNALMTAAAYDSRAAEA